MPDALALRYVLTAPEGEFVDGSLILARAVEDPLAWYAFTVAGNLQEPAWWPVVDLDLNIGMAEPQVTFLHLDTTAPVEAVGGKP